MVLSIPATIVSAPLAAGLVLLAAASGSASAQQSPAPAPSQAPAQAAPPAQQQFQQSQEWGKLPKMQLERQFSGPLQDTVVQRLRDPVDGTICYLYLPISVAHSPTTATGFVQYGSNGVGSISCTPGSPVVTGSTARPVAPLKR